MAEYAREELLACAVARLIGDAAHVAVGAASPIPATACALLEAQGRRLRVSLLHQRAGNPFTEGSRELFDLAGQGRIDVFFLGGAQIDGQANVNLVRAGARRFPGSFGSAFMYFAARRTILFREEHSPRVLVPKVDFVSAPGASSPEVRRRGGPQALITGKAVFRWQAERTRFTLESVHPGHDLAQIREQTGFDYDVAKPPASTPVPTAEELALLRGRVAQEMAANYPEFARRVWALGAAA